MTHPELSKQIAKALYKADMLKMSRVKRGWGLSKYLVDMAAEVIAKLLAEQEEKE